jgi:hypothetical protein
MFHEVRLPYFVEIPEKVFRDGRPRLFFWAILYRSMSSTLPTLAVVRIFVWTVIVVFGVSSKPKSSGKKASSMASLASDLPRFWNPFDDGCKLPVFCVKDGWWVTNRFKKLRETLTEDLGQGLLASAVFDGLLEKIGFGFHSLDASSIFNDEAVDLGWLHTKAYHDDEL